MKLSEVQIKGFKSIDGELGQSVSFGDVTLLLGANGAGKSNLVSFFKMLSYMATGALGTFTGKYGVDQILFYGPQRTPSLSLMLKFCDDMAEDQYKLSLCYGLPDRLFVGSEIVTFQRYGVPQPQEYSFASGGAETQLQNDPRRTSRVLSALLSGIRFYQFHDTSDTAKIKSRGYVDDARYLRHDAGNLAAFLRMLKKSKEYLPYYERIVRRISEIVPQFRDFVLEPVPGNEDYVRLNWTDCTGNEYLFSPDQLSDGSLRFMALTALLMQPPQLLPRFIVIDEPELGLHPEAIAALAGMIKSASQNVQILAATQSMRLVDEFNAGDILIAEHNNKRGCSQFRRLDERKLSDWLERYSLSELWEKNVLGGQP